MKTPYRARSNARLAILPAPNNYKTLCTFLMLLLVAAIFLTTGCTSVTIVHYRNSDKSTVITKDDAVVVLGRRTSSDYETEVDLIACVGDVLSSGGGRVNVIPEQRFVDELYPWFEPRNAPLHVDALKRISQRPEIAEVFADLNIRYIVWIDGKTETTASAGSIGCSFGMGGGGCFGFGTWDRESEYEAAIWDYNTHELLGKISADASGTSYMPAVVVPIPLIARVQNNACKGMAAQLKEFFSPLGQQLSQTN